ncbi:MAG: DapH/DapD/GlmU-related protein [Cyanobacteria bacterium P01_A01_bin.45]
MNYNNTPLKSKRIQEFLLTNLLSDISIGKVGSKLRTFFYRGIFAHIGQGVNIQKGADFMNCPALDIGNWVHILQGVHINALGHPNNRIFIRDGVQINYGVDIRAMSDTQIEIGEGTFIGPYVCFAGPGDITIGKGCLIAAHSGIFANNHKYADPIQFICEQGITRKGIVIEDDCWLGHGVTVVDGVTIGKGSVVGAGSVVTKDIPPYSIAVGTPAKVLKRRPSSKELVNLSE